MDAGPRFYKSLDLQKQDFQSVLERCADAGGKLLSVHSVRSSPAVLDMVEEFFPLSRGTVVLDWFTGTIRDAQRAAGLGCYFSVNAAMTRTAKGQALVKALPLNRILTETDGPFTLSEDQRPAEPRSTHEVVNAIAALRSAERSGVTAAVVSNLLTLLGPSDTPF
ncbi:TatD family hydrolase [Mycolicibacterium goodii]|uniref:TatD family hydrolase n=1 Tax=Mycolicibacterium goodii TaxID=134601 RepID=UPI001F04DFBA|nr:TatD family hydrolase [Mycolicibacterium goodii]ULN47773.1 TatD family hydrolase [Mycolicibacterium goodii]